MVVVAALHVGMNQLLQSRVRSATATGLNLLADSGALVSEALLSIRSVQTFGAEAFHAERLRRLLENGRSASLRRTFPVTIEPPLRDTLNAVAVALAVLVSFTALSRGRLTLPGFVLFVVVARQATIPLSRLASSLIMLQMIAGASERLSHILGIAPPLDGGLETPPLRESIEFQAVDFQYEPESPVLRSVSFCIRRGSSTAVVGPSGSGKSTLLDILLRLEEPSAGRLLYDGVDVREFRLHGYRRRFGVVPQEVLLANATIADNVAYGRPGTVEDVTRAIAVAQALDTARDLEGRAAPLVGDRGVMLSGGERQRVAIARAVYADPDVLVLDEATSALDAKSERLVQEAIDRAVSGRTALVVAHRLSTVMRAERILVLNKGRVVGFGCHEELMAANPFYRQLVDEQLARSPDDLWPPADAG
jgi:ABC-type multidrug transport system fused ATPase/permease subunit